MMKVFAILGILVPLLIGCASAPKVQYQGQVQGVTVVAQLYKDNNGDYQFTHFFAYGARSSARVTGVRMNDGKPLWNTNCKYSSRFRSNCANNDAHFIFDGMFYEDEYLDAYSEAMDNWKDRATFGQAMDKINAHYQEVESLLAKKKDILNAAKQKQTVNLVMDDKSGFMDSLPSGMQSRVKIVNPLLYATPLKRKLSGTTFKVLETKIHNELSANASAWAKKSSNDVTCDSSRGWNPPSFTFKFECPKSISVSAKSLNAKLIVLDKSFKQVYPERLYAQDSNIGYEFNGFQLSLINNTKSFISVPGISFYYGGKISSINNMSITLPPNSRVKAATLHDFNIDKSKFDFAEITKPYALRTKLKFGFAIQYIKDGRQKTLYEEQTFSLYDMIKYK